jgi:hypothetical protein
MSGTESSNGCCGEIAETGCGLGVIWMAMGEQRQGNPCPATTHKLKDPLQVLFVERSRIDHDALR